MNPGEYPLPSHAAYIWMSGDDIMIGLPPLPGNEKGHTVRLPASAGGLKACINILRERERGLRGIGTASDPVQYDLDAIIKKLRTTKPMSKHAKALAEADEILKELGL